MLGHSSPATTRIYAKVSSKRMRDAHRAAFNYRGEDDD
jgi:site-specific recombinase XerD